MTLLRCPICERLFESDQSPALPFCGRRCRQVDLQRWLGEQYGVPYESEDDSPDAEPTDREWDSGD